MEVQRDESLWRLLRKQLNYSALANHYGVVLVTHHRAAFADRYTAIRYDIIKRSARQDAAVFHNNRILDIGILLDDDVAEQDAVAHLALNVAAVRNQ